MIQKNFILSLLFLISVLATASFFSVLWYLDPYIYNDLAIALIAVSFFLMVLGIVSIMLFVIKKIYFRGETELSHIIASMRQATFIAFYAIGVCVGISIGISLFVPIITLFFMFLFLELFFQTKG